MLSLGDVVASPSSPMLGVGDIVMGFTIGQGAIEDVYIRVL